MALARAEAPILKNCAAEVPLRESEKKPNALAEKLGTISAANNIDDSSFNFLGNLQSFAYFF